MESSASNSGFSVKEISQIQKEFPYYDKYILVTEKESTGFIKIWRQSANDPYLALTLDDCEITNFKGKDISLDVYIDVLDELFEVPQIARCETRSYDTFINRGFQPIVDQKSKTKQQYQSSELIPVKAEVSNKPYSHKLLTNMRPMKQNDLEKIREIFFKEYGLRYKAVPIMYNYDPTSCAVYDDGQIRGLIFAEEQETALHIHQIFVTKENRGRNLDKCLFSWINQKAIEINKHITGTIRGNLLKYYMRFGLRIDPELQEKIEHYLVRFQVNKQQ